MAKTDGKDFFGRLFDKIVKKLETGIMKVIDSAEVTPGTDEDGKPRMSVSIEIGGRRQEVGSVQVVQGTGETANDTSPDLKLLPAEHAVPANPAPSDTVADKAIVDDNAPVVQMGLSEAIKAEAERREKQKQSAQKSEASPSTPDAASDHELDTDVENESVHVWEHDGMRVENDVLTAYTGKATSVEIPRGVREIGPRAFEGASVVEVSVPFSCKVIRRGAFRQCAYLERISLTVGLREIGEAVFEDCVSLGDVELPSSLEKIGRRAFAGCVEMSHVKLPSGLREIPDRLFEECLLLETVDWPKEVESYGNGVFADCFDDDAWEVFTRSGKKVVRRPAPAARLDPDGICDMDCSAYGRRHLNRLLNRIWADSAMHLDDAQERMDQTLAAIRLSDALSCADPFCRLQTIWACEDFFAGVDAGSNVPDDVAADLLAHVLDAIGGNGESWKEADDRIYRDIFAHEDDEGERIADSDEQVRAVMEKLYLSVMTDLGIAMLPWRYHPGIYHNAAWMAGDETYWRFVYKLEGLVRHRGGELPANVACTPEDGPATWLRKWSETLGDWGILCLGDPECGRYGGYHVAVVTEDVAHNIRAVFRDLGLDRHVAAWFHGENIFGLMII